MFVLEFDSKMSACVDALMAASTDESPADSRKHSEDLVIRMKA
jgi:hypothetical protein